MILQQFDREEFVRNYWQKKPLLIRNQASGFADPVTGDELAGLACEEMVESRLVSTAANGSLELRHGPFEPSVFENLADNNWTLLVQAVDQYVAEVDALKSCFDFIPSWRIDDVMVSYACDGGGVGPHYDQYDVFLIQGAGSRNWKIGATCHSGTPLRTDSELRVLQQFEPELEYVLNPGDILYVPPKFAHHGVSIGESLCYSVGFRAPSLVEMIQGYTDTLTDGLSGDRRYIDSDAVIPVYPGEITGTAINTGFALLLDSLEDKSAFTDWFGCYVTTPKYPEKVVEIASAVTGESLRDIIKLQEQPIELTKNSSSRFAYFVVEEQVRLYVDGECFLCQGNRIDLIQGLCDLPWTQALSADEYFRWQDTRKLLASLISQGSILLSDGY
ncbi:MAG: cupin domain-containing protein [Gammaproteobacteria bacterium]|nr:cupin domain-containing protein [Gammaproteobacteria bacterium]